MTTSRDHDRQAYLAPSWARLLAEVESAAKSRREEGGWQYGDTGVSVPGATDVLLSSVIDGYSVSTMDGKPSGALVPAKLVDDDPSLAFVRSAGLRLRGEDPRDDVYRVDQATWEEHAGRPVGVDAPEDGPNSLERRVAIEERDLRLARACESRQLERRTQAVALAAALGMTRKQAAGILELTPGRVQQLIDDLSPQAAQQVADTVEAIAHVLEQVGPVAQMANALDLPDIDGGVLDVLVDLGLVELDGGSIRLTDRGDEVKLLLHTRRRARKGSP